MVFQAMIISERKNFLFVSNPKAATHTMYEYLAEHWGGVQHTYGPTKFHPVPGEGRYAGHYKWTIVRNPYSRAVAAWWRAVATMPYCETYRPMVKSASFPAFCKWLAERGWVDHWSSVFPPQAERMAGIAFDSVLRLENLDDDFKALPFVNGEVPPIPSLHVGDYGDWRDWYDPDGVAAKAVREWAAVDFHTYGYPRDLDLTGRSCS